MATFPHSACIALGSNLGNRQAHLEGAIASLGASESVRVVARSSFHETDAVGGPPGQPRYLNAAIRIETELPPGDLLRALLRLEAEHGRVRDRRDAPRTLDLDLLLYDDWILDHPELQIPHPRMHQRLFVLAPLVEIAPTFLHPTLARTVSELHRELIATSSREDP